MSCEISDRGADTGFEAIKASFQHKYDVSRAIPGVMSHLSAFQSVIEIDEGGKTATGLWVGFGPLSAPSGDNSVEAMWNWGKYDMRYIRENGN